MCDGKAVPEGYLTVVQYAALKGSPETVRVLVRLGANTESISNDGQTALHYAVQHATLETLLDLMELGAKPAAKQETDSDGGTELHVVARDGLAEVVWFLLDRGANIEAEVDDRRKESGTASIFAARGGQLEVVGPRG